MPVLYHGELKVHPEVENHLNNLFKQSFLHRWWGEQTDSALGQMARGVSRFALHDAQQYFKGTLFSLAPFHQVNIGFQMMTGHRQLPWGGERIDPENNPGQMDAMRNGLMIAPNRVGQEYFKEGVGGGKNLVTLGLRKLADMTGVEASRKAANGIDAYTDWLFTHYIPSLAYKGYQGALERNLQRFDAQIKSGRVTVEQVKGLTADQINASTGLLNKDIQAWGSNPDLQQALSIAFIAPHFGESRIRHGFQAVGGVGSRKGWEQLSGVGITVATMWVAARVINYMNDQDPHFDHPFEAHIGNGWYTVRSIPGDMMRMLPTSVTSAIGLPDQGAGSGPFVANRLGPLFKIWDVMADRPQLAG